MVGVIRIKPPEEGFLRGGTLKNDQEMMRQKGWL